MDEPDYCAACGKELLPDETCSCLDEESVESEPKSGQFRFAWAFYAVGLMSAAVTAAGIGVTFHHRDLGPRFDAPVVKIAKDRQEPKKNGGKARPERPVVSLLTPDLSSEFDRFFAAINQMLGELDPPPETIVLPSELTSDPGDPNPGIAHIRKAIANAAETTLFLAHPSARLLWFDEDARTIEGEEIVLTYHFLYRSIVDERIKTTAIRFRLDSQGRVIAVDAPLHTDRVGRVPFDVDSEPYLAPMARTKLADHLDRKPTLPQQGGEPSTARRLFRDWLREPRPVPRDGLVHLLNAEDPELREIIHFVSRARNEIDDATPRAQPGTVALNFRNPVSGAQSFLNALRSRNQELLAQCLSKTAPREANVVNREWMTRALIEELPESKLSEWIGILEGFRIDDTNTPKNSGSLGVILHLKTKKNTYNCTIQMKREGDQRNSDNGAWKVQDVSQVRAERALAKDSEYAFWHRAISRAAVSKPEIQNPKAHLLGSPRVPKPVADAKPEAPQAGPALGRVVLLLGRNADVKAFADHNLQVGEEVEVRRPASNGSKVGMARVVKSTNASVEVEPLEKTTIRELDTLHRVSAEVARFEQQKFKPVDWDALNQGRIFLKYRPQERGAAEGVLATVTAFARRPVGEAGEHGGQIPLSPEEHELNLKRQKHQITEAEHRRALQEIKSKRELSPELDSLSVRWIIPGEPLRPAVERKESTLKPPEVCELSFNEELFVSELQRSTIARWVDYERGYLLAQDKGGDALTSLKRRAADAVPLVHDLSEETHRKEDDHIERLRPRVQIRVDEALRAAPVQFVNKTGSPVVVFITSIHDQDAQELELFQGAGPLESVFPFLEAYRRVKNLSHFLIRDRPFPVLGLGPGRSLFSFMYRKRPVITSSVSYYTWTPHGYGPMRRQDHEHFDEPFEIAINDDDVHCPTEVLAQVVKFEHNVQYEHALGCKEYNGPGRLHPYRVHVCVPDCFEEPNTHFDKEETVTTILVRNPTRKRKSARLRIEFDTLQWIQQPIAVAGFFPLLLQLEIEPDHDKLLRIVTRPRDFRVPEIFEPPIITDLTDCE